MPEFLTHDGGTTLNVSAGARSVASASTPFWSVIVPLCNRTEFLAECLASIFDQRTEHSSIEIIVHDNCSDVDLRPVVDAAGRGRVRLEHTQRRLGLYGNLNEALTKCRGEWIHILHDDDWVLPGFYERMKNAVARQPEYVAMACCHYTNVYQVDSSTWSPPALMSGPGILERWLERLAVANPLTVPAVVHRRSALARIGKFREDLPFTGDWEFYIRTASQFGCWYQPENLARFRVHARSQTAAMNLDGTAARDIRRTLEIAREFLPAARRAPIRALAAQYHAAIFLRHAADAFNGGQAAVGQHWLRECALLDEGIRSSPAYIAVSRHPLASGLGDATGE